MLVLFSSTIARVLKRREGSTMSRICSVARADGELGVLSKKSENIGSTLQSWLLEELFISML